MAALNLLHGQTLLIGVAVLIPAWFLWSIISTFYLSKLARFPGPKIWAYTNIPSQVTTIVGRPHTRVRQLFEQYGPAVRIGPNELAFGSAQAFRDIYSMKPGRDYFLKDFSFYRNELGADHIICVKNMESHARQRRMLSRAFSEKSIREQEPMLDEYVDKLMNRLREASQGNKPVEIVQWFNFTTFDITGDILFGESFHCLDGGKLHPLIKFNFDSIKSMVILSAISRMPGMSKLWQYAIPKSAMEEYMNHYNIVGKQVRQRIENGETSHPDLVSLLLRDGFTEKGGGIAAGDDKISLDELQANAFILIMAGSETTASLLTGLTYLLLSNPATMKKLVSEIRSAFPSRASINKTAADQLQYLSAVISEGLRLFPPAAVGLPRVVPPNGETIDGQWVPGGTVVAGHHYAAYHQSANFAEPDLFAPERWLDEKSGKYANDKRDVVNPFSLGPQNCIGMK